jgi:monovalent cation:H+ antiporter-2, CPA2 family
VALVLAFALGALANRLKLPPLVGYLIAGVLVGPHTPGFVADQSLAQELSEIGVILLMFGIGLHFSLRDLLSVRAIALPGALVQIAGATGLGLGLALLMGWPISSGLLFGLALSVASTVVLIKALQDRHMIDSERGRIAVGWLIVEDLAMVLALVLIPALAGVTIAADGHSTDPVTRAVESMLRVDLGVPGVLAVTVLKVAAFVAVRRSAVDTAGAALHRPHRQPGAVPSRSARDCFGRRGGCRLPVWREPRTGRLLCWPRTCRE